MICIKFGDVSFYSLSHSCKNKICESRSCGGSCSFSNGVQFSFSNKIIGSLNHSETDYRNISRSRSWRNAY